MDRPRQGSGSLGLDIEDNEVVIERNSEMIENAGQNVIIINIFLTIVMRMRYIWYRMYWCGDAVLCNKHSKSYYVREKKIAPYWGAC